MKVKFNLYISSPEVFAKDPKNPAGYHLERHPYRYMDDTWMFVTEIEADIGTVNTNKIVESATADLNAEIGRHTAAITVLENRKAELLALPSPS